MLLIFLEKQCTGTLVSIFLFFRRPRLPTAPSDSLTRLRDRSNTASNVKSKYIYFIFVKFLFVKNWILITSKNKDTQ